MTDRPSSYRTPATGLGTALCVLLVGAGCTIGLVLSFALRFPPTQFTTVWLPGGVLLAALLLFLAVLMKERQRDITDRKRTEEALRGNEMALRASYEQVQDLAGRLIASQEAERTRIARELHDDISQQLAALSIALSSLKRRLPEDAAEAHDELVRLQRRTVELSDDIRHLSHELHPGVLQHAGLVAALKAHCAEFRALHAIEVTVDAEDLDGIPPAVSLCLYRVAQEALQNVARHAGACRARVVLVRSADGLELSVSDDGCGFDLAEARRAGGLGLISLDERVRLVRGNVKIDTRPQWGTELRVRVPLGEPDHAPCESASRR